MRGRLRYLLALGFIALFALLPAPDSDTGKPYVAYLQVRTWLLGDDSPFASWNAADRAPQLVVDLRQSPPIEDPALLAERTAEFARITTEWAMARQQTDAPEPGTVAPTPVQLPLTVTIGSNGVRATLPTPVGEPAVFEAFFPSRASLLPACVTIVIALVFRRVLLALLAGGLIGAIAFCLPHDASLPDFFRAIASGSWHFAADALFARSLCSDFYLRITMFVVFLFMTVGVITRNGGVHGTVEVLQRRVHGAVSAQLATWATGLTIFFDDYTNCMVTGTAMRPLTDSQKISREKLAYIVDSTAAPVAGVSLFSTWITYEISQFRAPLTLVTDSDGRPYTEADAFDVFLATLPFRFYCFLALMLVPLVVLMRRDFGPMLAAERRARAGVAATEPGTKGLLRDTRAETPVPGVPLRARNGILPMCVLILGAATAILGFDIESDVALFFSSGAAYLVAVALTLGQRLLSLRQLLSISLGSTRVLVPAFGILFLAWTLGHISNDLDTSFFLCAGARDAMAAEALPLVLFGLSGLVAFATGTSFGTMAILLPNVVVLAHGLGADASFLGDPQLGGPALMVLSIGAVLEGAIFGDHCSPISDTTVLSSLGSRCDHLAHVSTQIPYALLTAAAALLLGYLPMVLLSPSWWPLSYLAAIVFFLVFLRVVGRDPARPPAPRPTRSSA